MTLTGTCTASSRSPRTSFDVDAVNEFLRTKTLRGLVLDHVIGCVVVREVNTLVLRSFVERDAGSNFRVRSGSEARTGWTYARCGTQMPIHIWRGLWGMHIVGATASGTIAPSACQGGRSLVAPCVQIAFSWEQLGSSTRTPLPCGPRSLGNWSRLSTECGL
jgi:hypothetical protein